MYCTRSLTAQEDGSIAITDADDITIVEPITTRKQTVGGYYRDEPDHETAALMAAAPDLFFALQAIVEDWNSEPTVYCPEVAAKLIAARAALKRAETPEYETNSIGQTRETLSAEFIRRPEVSAYLDSAERSLEDCP